MKNYAQIMEEIEQLSHYREFTCRVCGHKQDVYILEIQGNCEKCNTRHKFRCFEPLGSEIEDVIDAVLVWLGTGDDWAAALQIKQAIDLAIMQDATIRASELASGLDPDE